MKRVVITGIGAVTPLGNDIESTWENLIQGSSGIAGITRFDTAGLKTSIAGELKGFEPERYLGAKDILRLDPFVHYGAAASLMAAKDAGFINDFSSSEIDDLQNAAIIIGSSRGGISSMNRAVEENILNRKPYSAYLMSASTINMAASYVSMRLGSKGPAIGISTACASGANAIGEAFRMVRYGECKVAFAGGADAPICRLALEGYSASGSLSARNDEPEKASRPFDAGRDGFVISEGAGVLVLEELEHAGSRGAKIYAELAGSGSSSDAFHQTRPDSTGEALATRNALDDSGTGPEEVDYINAHATSTSLGDRAEAEAVRKVFGPRTDEIYVGASKSCLGHMLGAAGAVETAITVVSLQKGIIPPVINLDNIDPPCKLNFVRSAVCKDIETAVSNSFGFGGVNAVLVMKKYNN